MKAYICSNSANGTENIDGIYYFLLETGECLYTHWCSNMQYARGDLYFNRPERITELTAKYGEIEVSYLSDDDMTFDELLARNRAFYADEEDAK